MNPPTIASVLAAGGDPWRSIGNAGRGVIVGPGLNLWDGGIMKRFPLWHERHALQFRRSSSMLSTIRVCEPERNVPVGANQTGRITGTSGPNRTIQLALVPILISETDYGSEYQRHDDFAAGTIDRFGGSPGTFPGPRKIEKVRMGVVGGGFGSSFFWHETPIRMLRPCG